MTNEEAIYTMKHAFLVDACGNTDKYLLAVQDMAVKALEKAEKYRWHDLRKNSEGKCRRNLYMQIVGWTENAQSAVCS